MRAIVILLAALLLLCASAQAQVINGEGTYEGSTLHDPPPAPTDTRAKGDKPRSPDAKSDHRDKRE